MNTQKGFFQLIALVILVVIILLVFNVDVATIWNVQIKGFWDTYFEKPVSAAWTIFKNFILGDIFDGFKAKVQSRQQLPE